MVGTWVGTVHTPWTDDYEVEMRFHASGRYEAYSRTPENAALYYGADGAQPGKTYFLDDVGLKNTASGTIMVVFPNPEFSNTTADDIEHLDVSPDTSVLTFEVVHLKQYGPLQYKLARVPTP